MDKAKVEKLIKNSLQKLQQIGWENKNCNKNQESRLIFPKYRDRNNKDGKKQEDNKRISEQEARFLFVIELENAKDTHSFYYSVETPTEFGYRFSENGKKINPKKDTGGQSGKIDICIYDTDCNRKHLVEFKAHNSDIHDFSKDFIKLKYEPKKNELEYEPNYFVHILKSYDGGTISSLEKKYSEAFKIAVDKDNNANITVDKDNNAKKANEVRVFLCILELKEKYKGKETIIYFDEKDYIEKLGKLL